MPFELDMEVSYIADQQTAALQKVGSDTSEKE